MTRQDEIDLEIRQQAIRLYPKCAADAGGLKALIHYYETHNTDLEGTDHE